MAENVEVLVVDDSELIRAVVEEIVSSLGYSCALSPNGRDALAVLEDSDRNISVIVLDWEMPEMDGITFMEHYREKSGLRDIPVIMLTSRDSEEDVMRGISAGVYYYLKKPVQTAMLIPIIKMAVHEHSRRYYLSRSNEADKEQIDIILKRISSKALDLDGKLKESEEEKKQLKDEISLLVSDSFDIESVGSVRFLSGKIVFKTISEGEKVSVWLGKKAMEPSRAVTGLNEIFTNAVEHGNLGIGYEEKSMLIAEDRLASEIKSRQKSESCCDKKVSVYFEVCEKELIVEVTDEGEGFDYEKFLSLTPERAFDAHGRGIFMTKNMYLKHLEYKNGGKTAVAYVER